MIAACITIVLMIFIMSFMFFRSGRKDYGIAILPLISVPLAHAAGYILAPYIITLFELGTKQALILIGIDLTSLMIGGILLGGTSKNIESKKNRNLFLILSALFLIILSWVLVNSIIDS